MPKPLKLNHWTQRATWLAAVVLMAGSALAANPTSRPAARAPRSGGTMSNGAAPDFPPGIWTDGADRHLSQYRGKVVIIFSFDPKYLDGPQEVKQKLKAFDLFSDKPVAFLGIVTGARDIPMTKALLKPIEVNAPMYIDNIGLTAARFNTYYSFGVRMIDADGNFAGYSATPQDLDRALKDVKWKYKDEGYDRHLDAIVDLLEWNHYEAGMKQLRPMRKSSNKEVAASAQKLYEVVHAEGEKWKEDADAAVESDPVKAFDLYAQIAAAFPGEDLGKAVDAPMKQLRVTKPLQEELAARETFSRLNSAVARANPNQRMDIADYVDSIGKRYPNTPTGAKAKALWNDIINHRTLD